MAVTNSEFTAWLNDQQADRVILADAYASVNDIETYRYVSSRDYTSTGSDTPPNECYQNIISDVRPFTETLTLDSSASMSFGEIQLANQDRALDSWVKDVWDERSIVVYIGDVSWEKSDFRVIFNGVIKELKVNGDKLIWSFRDKSQRLNTPVSVEKLGAASANSERLKPVLIGEAHNISPLLVDEATHQYQYHVTNSEGLIEVRDNGVPVEYTDDPSTGTFTLNQSLFGVLTCSAQGHKNVNYFNTVASSVETLATEFGKTSEQFTLADIDATNFTDFNLANPQPVGIPLSDRSNTLGIINRLASSVGAQMIMSRAGKMRLLKIDLPAPGAVTEISPGDIKQDSLKIEQRISPKSAVKIGYCKNYTVQRDLQTDIPVSHKEMYALEWLDTTSINSAVAAKYRQTTEPVMKETLLLDKPDAETEAARLAAFYAVPRTVYGFEGYAPMIELELGSAINLTHDRYDLSSGIEGMVIKLQINWMNLSVRVSVIT